MNIEKLGDKTRSEIIRLIQKELDIYSGEINAAYIKHKDDPLAISFKVSVKRLGDENKVTVDISFRPEPDTKDQEVGIVSETQMDLFDEAA
jgi:hypothetical protein